MDLQLHGRRALVTGGSRGIGKAVATALAAEGAQVAIAARSTERLTQAAADIGARVGVEPYPVAVDTSDADSVNAMIEQVNEGLGGVDILVNCAATPGGQTRPPSLAEISADMFWSDFNVKVLGYLRCAQAVAPGMIEHGWGRIINVSGLAARSTGSTIGSMRNVSVAAMTKNLADELGPHGINVTVVHPGLTRTEATPAVFAAAATAQGVTPEEIETRFAAANTVGRVIDASDVAAVIAFLASPLSIAINGDAIACGGGIPRAIHY